MHGSATARTAAWSSTELTDRPGHKTSIVADSSKLTRASDVEARRTAWRSVLEELHLLSA